MLGALSRTLRFLEEILRSAQDDMQSASSVRVEHRHARPGRVGARLDVRRGVGEEALGQRAAQYTPVPRSCSFHVTGSQSGANTR